MPNLVTERSEEAEGEGLSHCSGCAHVHPGVHLSSAIETSKGNSNPSPWNLVLLGKGSLQRYSEMTKTRLVPS